MFRSSFFYVPLFFTETLRTLMIPIIFRTLRSPILIQVTSSWTGLYISSLPANLDQVYFNYINTVNACTFEELRVGLNVKNRTYWRSIGNKRSQYISHLSCTPHSTSKASRGEKWSMNINRCLLKRKAFSWKFKSHNSIDPLSVILLPPNGLKCKLFVRKKLPIVKLIDQKWSFNNFP